MDLDLELIGLLGLSPGRLDFLAQLAEFLHHLVIGDLRRCQRLLGRHIPGRNRQPDAHDQADERAMGATRSGQTTTS